MSIDLYGYDVIVDGERYTPFKFGFNASEATGWAIHYKNGRIRSISYRKRNGTLFLRESKHEGSESKVRIHVDKVKNGNWKCSCPKYQHKATMICVDCLQMKGDTN